MIIQDTSIEAKNYMDTSGHSSNMRKRILQYIIDRKGATCDEVEVDLGMKHQSASASIRQLVKDEILIRSPEKRLTRSCRRAIVWKLNENKQQIELFS